MAFWKQIKSAILKQTNLVINPVHLQTNLRIDAQYAQQAQIVQKNHSMQQFHLYLSKLQFKIRLIHHSAM